MRTKTKPKIDTLTREVVSVLLGVDKDLGLQTGSKLLQAEAILYPYRAHIPGTVVDDVLSRIRSAVQDIEQIQRQLLLARRGVRRMVKK